MTDADRDALDTGEWAVFVARAVQDVRRAAGESAANQVAAILRDLRSEADLAARAQLASTRGALERTVDDVAEARRSHERLQADVSRMELAVREAKAEAAAIRSESKDDATRRRADVDAYTDAEHQRMKEAWEEIRQHESDVAARRSQLLDLDERTARRVAEIQAAEAELAETRFVVERDLDEAQVIIDDGLRKLAIAEERLDAAVIAADAAEAIAEEATAAAAAAELERAAAEEMAARAAAAADEAVESAVEKSASPEINLVDLRDEIDLRLATLDERETELDEWEADLVSRARDLEARFTTHPGALPPVGRNTSGWGRRGDADEETSTD